MSGRQQLLKKKCRTATNEPKKIDTIKLKLDDAYER